MKRIFGFVLGAVIGLALVYVVRRWVNAGSQTLAPTTPTLPTTVETPALSTTETLPSEAPKTGRFTVRTTGPRPQSSISEVSSTTNGTGPVSAKADAKEPVAAQETDDVAASGRAEMETLSELALAEPDTSKAPTNVLPKVMPAPETQKDESLTAPEAESGDDFNRIRGIGEVTSQKLHTAGIHTFAQFAALTVAEIEEKTGFSEGRIRQNKLVEQAAALANGEELTDLDTE